MSHTLNPSNGFVPLVDPPATPTSVGSQSETCISSRLMVPGFATSGPVTKATPLTPPSQRDHFLPRRGQLLPPASVWPPLSRNYYCCYFFYITLHITTLNMGYYLCLLLTCISCMHCVLLIRCVVCISKLGIHICISVHHCVYTC